MAEGVLHEFEGWVVFALCLLVLAGLVALLLRVRGRGTFNYDLLAWPRGPFLRTQPQLRKIAVLTILLCLSAAALEASGGLRAQEVRAVTAHRDLRGFPLQLGNWRGQQEELEPQIFKTLGLSDYWLADYETAAQASFVNLYIAYYASQQAGATIHSPSTCLPGGGWEIESLGTVRLALPEVPLDSVARMVIGKAGQKQLVYYWFNQSGSYMASRWAVKKELLLASLLRKPVDGALIRLYTPVVSGEDMDSAERRLQAFLQEAFAPVHGFMPRRDQ